MQARWPLTRTCGEIGAQPMQASECRPPGDRSPTSLLQPATMRSLAPATALCCDHQDGDFERDGTMCGPILGADAQFMAGDKPDQALGTRTWPR